MEVPVISKGVLENLFATMKKEPSPGYCAYPPIPVFQQSSSKRQSDRQQTSGNQIISDFSTALPRLRGNTERDSIPSFMALPEVHFTASSSRNLKHDEAIEDITPKRIRKNKGDAVILASESTETPAVQKRKRSTPKAIGVDDNTDKQPSRKRNILNNGDSKNGPFPTWQRDPISSNGALGFYGAKESKVGDFPRHVNDTSMENLLSRNFQGTIPPSKQDNPSNNVNDDPLDKSFSALLHNNFEMLPSVPFRPPVKTEESIKPSAKLELDLERPPVEDNQENPSSVSAGKSLKLPLNRPDSIFQGSRMPEELMNQRLPVMPPSDFWGRFQLGSAESFCSFTSYPASSFPVLPHMLNGYSSGIPFSLFSMNPGQSTEEVSNCRTDLWCRSESPMPYTTKNEAFEKSKECVHTNQPVTKGVYRQGGLFEIDLNKELVESELCESFHGADECTVPASCLAAEPCNIELMPTKENNEITCDSYSQSDCARELGTSVSICSKKSEAQVDTQYRPDSQISMNGSGSIESLRSPPEGLSPLSIPVSELNNQDSLSDIPCSPGVHAIAEILWKMSQSSSLFFVEKDQLPEQPIELTTKSSVKQTMKTARPKGIDPRPLEKMPFYAKIYNDGQLSKNQSKNSKDTKDRNRHHHCDNSSKGNVSVQLTEPWAFTPPRVAHKSVNGNSFGNRSPESDRSPSHRVKHLSTNELHSKSRSETHQNTSVKIVNPKKNSKTGHVPISDAKFLYASPSKGLFLNQTSNEDVKQGDRINKISRPRSSSGRSSFSSQRSDNARNSLHTQRAEGSFSAKPRSSNGCSVKTFKPPIPYIEEVSQVSK